jgi:16S rRNA (guanine966-N2)-methyltransferase
VWDVVFVDPPYASDLAVRAVTAIPAGNLSPNATIVIEHDRRHAPPDTFGSLVRTDERRYGDTLVSFYRFT